MNNEIKEIIIDFLSSDEDVEEVDLDLYIEEISPFEVTIHQWLDEELNGHSFNEGSIPLDISCATIHLESLKMRRVKNDGKVSLL